jgi:hypothetical protein
MWPSWLNIRNESEIYLSVNVMSEIGFVMSCLTRYMTKPTQKLGEYAKQVVRYQAWGRRDAKLT